MGTVHHYLYIVFLLFISTTIFFLLLEVLCNLLPKLANSRVVGVMKERMGWASGGQQQDGHRGPGGEQWRVHVGGRQRQQVQRH